MCARTLLLNAKLVSNTVSKELSGLFINEDGRIADIFSMDDYDRSKYHGCPAVMDVKGALVSAGLIDTHIHGIGGFGTDDAKEQSILEMSKCLAKFGVTGFLPTLYAGTVEKMEREVKAIVSAMGKEQGAKILGINLEGPFLNPAKSGAQDKDNLSLPSAQKFIRLIEAGQKNIVAMTVAPELEGIEEIAQIAKENNIVLLMGHTNATYEQAKAGMEMGILHATHMFNAMSPMDHKRPGVSGAVLFDPRSRCEIIADGVHVNKDLVKHVIDSKPEGKVVLITDSLSPTSLGKGIFKINGFDVTQGERGGFVDVTNHDQLCGSSLTLNKAVANVISWGVDPSYAIRLATENPAKTYGFGDMGILAKGHKADIAVFADDMEVLYTFVNGNLTYYRR